MAIGTLHNRRTGGHVCAVRAKGETYLQKHKNEDADHYAIRPNRARRFRRRGRLRHISPPSWFCAQRNYGILP